MWQEIMVPKMTKAARRLLGDLTYHIEKDSFDLARDLRMAAHHASSDYEVYSGYCDAEDYTRAVSSGSR